MFCAPDRPDRPTDPLKAAAAELGLPIVQPASYRDAAAGAAMRELSPDLCVMAYVTQFIPDEVLAIPTLGSIQYHPSLLPASSWPELDQLADHRRRVADRGHDLLA